MKQLSLTKLKTALHTALKQYTKNGSDQAPLGDLYLFQQANMELGNPQTANRHLILEGIEQLAMQKERYAQLLQLRFIEEWTVTSIAQKLSIAEGTAYKWQNEALQQLAELLHEQETDAREVRRQQLARRFDLPPPVHLIGVKEYLLTLLDLVCAPGPPWLIAIEGIGGIGKTTLANALLRELVLTGRFKEIIWICARQQTFQPAGSPQLSQRPALDEDALFNALLEQLNNGEGMAASPQSKLLTLSNLLKTAPYFIVIDNLETTLDYQTLLPTLHKLANPSRFLLTSRHSLQAQPDIACFPLKELNQADAFALLKYEATVQRLAALTTASEAQLQSIYNIVGGNPLALKLIVGQLSRFPLSHVLTNLQKAQGQKIDALYTHIYRQVWQSLDSISQQVLLIMPLAQRSDITHLKAISKLESATLNQALENLLDVSLLQVSGDLDERYYHIHQLTKSFLLTEVVNKWQAA